MRVIKVTMTINRGIIGTKKRKKVRKCERKIMFRRAAVG